MTKGTTPRSEVSARTDGGSLAYRLIHYCYAQRSAALRDVLRTNLVHVFGVELLLATRLVSPAALLVTPFVSFSYVYLPTYMYLFFVQSNRQLKNA